MRRRGRRSRLFAMVSVGSIAPGRFAIPAVCAKRSANWMSSS
jgi:hypothetical protein